MAITVTWSNHGKFQLAKGLVDLSADTLKVILMNTTFAFDPDADATLADVTADQLATEGGYTQDSKTLTSVVLTEDDTGNQAQMTCDDVSWTATAAGIGPTGGAIVYDDTTADDTVLCSFDFGADYSISDGSTFQLQDLILNIT